jgi:predicted transcriptional regulator
MLFSLSGPSVVGLPSHFGAGKPDGNLIGSRFLARHLTTFNFPKRAMCPRRRSLDALNSRIAFFTPLWHRDRRSDKVFAMDSIRRPPEDAGVDTIAERLEFLAAIRKGPEQIERVETVPHEEVKRRLATWLSE